MARVTARPDVRYVPPGRDTWHDPFTMYRRLRDHDPVHHVEDGDYWVLSRFDHVMAAVQDPERFSSAGGLTFRYDEVEASGLGEATPMVFLDPPDHTEFRRLVAQGFTPRRVATIEDDVREFVGERLERLQDAGGGDVVAELLKPLPSFVVAHYLGVPEEDRGRFDAWTDAVVAANVGGITSAPVEAVSELFAYFTELIERRRHDPADDVVSALAELTDSTDLTPLRILGFCFTMVAGGNDTTTGLLSAGLELLAANPEQRARMVDDPAVIPDAVEELLRLTSPVQGLARTTTTDVEIDGTVVPRGRKVLLLYGSANRDEREFGPDAGELDVDRRPRQILSFAHGNHYCLGAAAARLMARVTLEELLARCPRFEVDTAAARFAGGSFVRRYEHLPFTPGADHRRVAGTVVGRRDA